MKLTCVIYMNLNGTIWKLAKMKPKNENKLYNIESKCTFEYFFGDTGNQKKRNLNMCLK